MTHVPDGDTMEAALFSPCFFFAKKRCLVETEEKR